MTRPVHVFVKGDPRQITQKSYDLHLTFGIGSYAAVCIRVLAAFISRAGGSPNRRPYSRVN